MRSSGDVENKKSWRRGRRPPPKGCGQRFGLVRVRFGERGERTTWGDLGREMGIHRDRPWSWETEGRFPGREKLAECLARLRRVREEGVDPAKLAEWVELGPDDKPPFDEDPPTRPPRVLEGGAKESRITKLMHGLEAIAERTSARALVADLLRAEERGDRVEVLRLVAAIKVLAETPAAKGLVAQLEEEAQMSPGLAVSSGVYLLLPERSPATAAA